MNRNLLVIIVLAFLVSACSCAKVNNEDILATNQAETLAAQPTDTPSDTPLPEGTVEIPDVIGMKRSEAYELLEELGLIPKTFWVMSDEFSYGIVTEVEPGVGELIQVDSDVILDVVGEVVQGPAGTVITETDEPGPVCGPEPSRMWCNLDPTYKNWCSCMGGMYFCDEITYKGSCWY